MAIREQGKSLLKSVEILKKETKRSYRQQVLGFETQDIDPFVWNRLLQQQQATQSQLNTLRGLRTQLLEACQMHSQELQVAGIRTITHEVEQVIELYSSDEEAQQISDQSRKNHVAFVVGIGKVLQKYIKKELLELLDNTLGTKVAPYVTFSSTPELPELLKAYIDSLQREEAGEQSAEMLGSLLTEAILKCFALSKAKKTKLNKIKDEIGQAAYQVVLSYNASQNPSNAKSVSR